MSLLTKKFINGNEITEIGAAGFEPTTPTTPKWCATKLRYAPIKLARFNVSYVCRFHQLSQKTVNA